MSYITVGEACERLRPLNPELHPREVSSVIYESRALRDWPVQAGRRLIPVAEMDALIVELRRAGKLPPLAMPKGK